MIFKERLVCCMKTLCCFMVFRTEQILLGLYSDGDWQADTLITHLCIMSLSLSLSLSPSLDVPHFCLCWHQDTGQPFSLSISISHSLSPFLYLSLKIPSALLSFFPLLLCLFDSLSLSPPDSLDVSSVLNELGETCLHAYIIMDDVN